MKFKNKTTGNISRMANDSQFNSIQEKKLRNRFTKMIAWANEN